MDFLFALRWRLRLERHFLQQSFDPHQPFVTLDGEMEWLTVQLDMRGVQERDDWPWRTEMAPCKAQDIALPPCLFWREPRDIAVPAKDLGLTTAAIGCGMINGR